MYIYTPSPATPPNTTTRNHAFRSPLRYPAPQVETEYGVTHSYPGNYRNFLKLKEERVKHGMDKWDAQRKEVCAYIYISIYIYIYLSISISIHPSIYLSSIYI